MEVDTENVVMDEADALMRADDGGGVITSNVNDDGAPTIEETYEITTTRRKTIRTSYKIQEVNCLMYIHNDCRNHRASADAVTWASCVERSYTRDLGER